MEIVDRAKDFILAYGPDIFAVYGALMVILVFIAKLTKTSKDDEILGKVRKYADSLLAKLLLK